jgi:AP-1 complex subunit gamma-1
MGASAPSPAASPAPVAASTPAHNVYSKDGLVLALQVQRSGATAQIVAKFRNESNFERLSHVGLQAAVPKSQKLQLSAISKAELDAGDEGVQTLRVTALNGVCPCPSVSSYISS